MNKEFDSLQRLIIKLAAAAGYKVKIVPKYAKIPVGRDYIGAMGEKVEYDKKEQQKYRYDFLGLDYEVEKQ